MRLWLYVCIHMYACVVVCTCTSGCVYPCVIVCTHMWFYMYALRMHVPCVHACVAACLCIHACVSQVSDIQGRNRTNERSGAWSFTLHVTFFTDGGCSALETGQWLNLVKSYQTQLYKQGSRQVHCATRKLKYFKRKKNPEPTLLQDSTVQT